MVPGQPLETMTPARSGAEVSLNDGRPTNDGPLPSDAEDEPPWTPSPGTMLRTDPPAVVPMEELSTEAPRGSLPSPPAGPTVVVLQERDRA